MIYEGTGAPGPCQWKDRSSVAIAPSALCVHCAYTGLGAVGMKVGGGRLERLLVECCGAIAGPVHLHHRQQHRSKAALFPFSKAHKPLKTSHNICTRGMICLCNARSPLNIASEYQTPTLNDIHSARNYPEFPFQ